MKKFKMPFAMHCAFCALAFMTTTCSSDEEFKPELGQKYGGGIIFYIDESGKHGLIAAANDQSTGAPWGCKGTYINVPGTTGTYTDVGWGESNTEAIVFNCTTSGIAAKLCDDLVLNGYKDWFLPSIDELTLLYEAKILPGLNLGEFQYWSSSQGNENAAFFKHFTSGAQDMMAKDYDQYSVRAVRKF